MAMIHFTEEEIVWFERELTNTIKGSLRTLSDPRSRNQWPQVARSVGFKNLIHNKLQYAIENGSALQMEFTDKEMFKLFLIFRRNTDRHRNALKKTKILIDDVAETNFSTEHLILVKTFNENKQLFHKIRAVIQTQKAQAQNS